MSGKKKIVLDCQHMGKPHNPLDRGARYKEFIESDICLQYASDLFKILTEDGFQPFLVTSGYYRNRAKFANAIKADVYLALHLNSSEEPPQRNHSMVEILECSGKVTYALADQISRQFEDDLDCHIQFSRVKILLPGDRGYSCINRVAPPALLLEPLFINHPESVSVFDNDAYSIAYSLSKALKSFDWEAF